MEQNDSRVDAYIAKAAPFSKPILEHIRQLVHNTSPLLKESIKWGFPFFEYKGPVCHMASFKQHCSFGFWKARQLNDPGKLIHLGEASAGSFGRLNTLADLPPDEALIDFILQAIKLNEDDKTSPVKKETTPKAPVPKAAIEMPVDFADLLGSNSKALEIFEKFSPSHKREYFEWIIDAKTDATRQKRMETAMEQIAEGKSRHWKYQR